jgi:hypothetical protein
MQEETPRKLEEKVNLASLNPGKESQVHPSSIALVSWEDGADEAKASKKSNPPNPANEGMERLASTPLSLNFGWTVVIKEKNTPSISQPMVTRSRARNPM